MNATELKTHPSVLRLAEIQQELGSPKDLTFAKQLHLGFHGANWGKIRAGTYSGNFSKALVNIEVAIESYENQGVGELEEGIVVLRHVREALDATDIALAADDEHRLVILSGPRGSGKSRTLQLIHAKHGGFITSARPSWSKSYLNFLNRLAETEGMSLGESRSAGEAETQILKFMKATPRKVLCIGEFNYFSSDALGFIKTILNETDWVIVADTIPHHLNRMASDRSTAQESAQLLRRAVAIIKIPAVSTMTVAWLARALHPDLDVAPHLQELAIIANQLDRIDSVCQILADCDPADPTDLPKAIQRHKRLHSVNLNTAAA